MPDPQEINDALTAISVLLVFVIAYYSALYPQLQQHLAKERSVVAEDNRTAANALRADRKLILGVAALGGVIFLLISKDSFEVVKAPSRWWPWSGHFVMAYGALMLVAFLLLVFLGVLVSAVLKIRDRVGVLTA